jgi:hypothetical protein
MSSISRYLARIGSRGGRRSRRVLSPDIARRMVRVREVRRGAGARLLAAIALRRTAWLVAQASLRQQHPAWSDARIGDELRRRFAEPVP